ncbi:MAG: hypothetical protein JHC61_14100 [Burkholderiaceae bacterium]|nr:hypothetical protein [Burkholderiaceae bacterium]
MRSSIGSTARQRQSDPHTRCLHRTKYPRALRCALRSRSHSATGAVAEWMIGGLAVLIVGILCVEIAWWQMARLRVSIASMEAARAVSRHTSPSPQQLDRVMRHAFTAAWVAPPRHVAECREVSGPPPCWTLKRLPPGPQAPKGSIRVHARYAFRPLTPLVAGMIRATASNVGAAHTRAAHARGALLIVLDIHIENQAQADPFQQ